MRSLSKIFATTVLAGAATLAACGGGSSDGPPGPLSSHFDDMYIAAIAPEAKPSVGQTQNDWSLARSQNAKAEADLNESATQIEVVRNEQKAARLGVDSAVSKKKAAEASADTNRINQAAKELHTAETVAKAADARVAYFEAYRAYLQVVLRHAQENMYWREAQYEVAKAQTAQKNNIAPKGVTYDAFPKQEQERGMREAAARQRLDSEKSRVVTARDSWLRAQQDADRESGRAGNLSDPMAPKS
jgi:hypothetical protein